MDPTETGIEATEHMAPLDADDIPNANQSHHCFSCKQPMTGVFCAACGQKNDDYRRSIFSLVKEVVVSITAVESRIWRTWGNLLFKPGKVAREYADGRRTYWSSPVRVYLAMSIILFSLLSVTNMQLISLDIDVERKAGITKPVEELTGDDLKIIPNIRFFETRKRVNERNKSRNFDLIALKVNSDNGIKINISTDKISYSNAAQAPNETTPNDSNEPKTENKVITFSSVDGKEYQLESWSGVLLAFIKNPTLINAAFYKYLPRIMFIMMPFTMLIGVIFIRGRGNALMYDHLVHAAYIHAVAFFFLLAGIMFGFAMPGTPIPAILFGLLLIYLPISLKRMFSRSWLKTIWTSYGVGFIYAFNMTLIMTGLLMLQVVTTLTELGTPLTP